MDNSPYVQLGQFSTVKTWVLYFVPTEHITDPLLQFVHEDKPVLVGVLAEDDSGNVCRSCHRCLHCANEGRDGECPGLDEHARITQRREQERMPDDVIEIAELMVPRYLNLGERIRHAVGQLNIRLANPSPREES